MKQYAFDKPAFMADLRKIVAIRSINGDCGAVTAAAPLGQGILDAIEYMLIRGREYGFRTKNLDGYCGWIEMGEGDEMIGILAHVDTVSVVEDGWVAPPFSADEVDGKIYGRGVGDDKGPAMLALYAMKAIADSGLKMNKRVRLIIGGDEEAGAWQCMNRYRDTEEAPTCAFTPDSTYPVTYAEKGILHLRFFRDLPAGGAPVLIDCGAAYNVVPAVAKAVVNGKEYAAEGKAAHAMEPQEGENAFFKLCDLMRADGITHPILDLAKMLSAEALGIALHDEPSGDLTINPALVHVTENFAEVKCDLRVPVTFTDKQVMETAAKAVAPLGFAVDSDHFSIPLHVDVNSPLVVTLQKVYKECTGRTDPPVSTGGGTYARAFPNAVAFGALFPEESGNFHQTNEFWYASSIEPNFQIFCNAIAELNQA